MFTRNRIAVASVGETVTLEIGSWRRSMSYEVALLLSWWMQKHARAARKFAGHGAMLRAAGTMHDAENPSAGQPFDPLRVRSANTDWLKREQITTRSDGDTVAVCFGADEMKLPYKAATTIAQWLRMRAKESKRRAGDVQRHWSVVGVTHDSNVGADVTRG